MNKDDLKSTIEKLYNDILINLDIEKIYTYFAPFLHSNDRSSSLRY